jgi:hypothetical protein
VGALTRACEPAIVVDGAATIRRLGVGEGCWSEDAYDGFPSLCRHRTSRFFNMDTLQEAIESKLDKVVEHYAQDFDVGCQELEATEEVVALSKGVPSYYKPLVEKLVDAAILAVKPYPTVRYTKWSQYCRNEKSYFNEGKILLFVDEDQSQWKREQTQG